MEIFPTSGLTGDGVGEVLDWVRRQVRGDDLHEAVVGPAKRAVPPSLGALCSSVSATLKLTLGSVKGKLNWS